MKLFLMSAIFMNVFVLPWELGTSSDLILLLAFACLGSKLFNRYVAYYGAQSVVLSFAAAVAAWNFHSVELWILAILTLAVKGIGIPLARFVRTSRPITPLATWGSAQALGGLPEAGSKSTPWGPARSGGVPRAGCGYRCSTSVKMSVSPMPVWAIAVFRPSVHTG